MNRPSKSKQNQNQVSKLSNSNSNSNRQPLHGILKNTNNTNTNQGDNNNTNNRNINRDSNSRRSRNISDANTLNLTDTVTTKKVDSIIEDDEFEELLNEETQDSDINELDDEPHLKSKPKRRKRRQTIFGRDTWNLGSNNNNSNENNQSSQQQDDLIETQFDTTSFNGSPFNGVDLTQDDSGDERKVINTNDGINKLHQLQAQQRQIIHGNQNITSGSAFTTPISKTKTTKSKISSITQSANPNNSNSNQNQSLTPNTQSSPNQEFPRTAEQLNYLKQRHDVWQRATERFTPNAERLLEVSKQSTHSKHTKMVNLLAQFKGADNFQRNILLDRMQVLDSEIRDLLDDFARKQELEEQRKHEQVRLEEYTRVYDLYNDLANQTYDLATEFDNEIARNRACILSEQLSRYHGCKDKNRPDLLDRIVNQARKCNNELKILLAENKRNQIK